MAQIQRAKFGAVDVDFILGVGGYDLDRSWVLSVCFTVVPSQLTNNITAIVFSLEFI